MKNAFLCIGAFILFGMPSCKVVRTLAELRQKEVKVYTYTWQDKQIAYLPMHHLGKPEFYESVKQKVVQYKQDGYTVYYELVTNQTPETDSLERLTILKKYRKWRGRSGNYKEQTAEVGVFKKYALQPSYPQLGTDSNDVRADVNVAQLVAEWERVNGPIILDSLDKATPLDAKYESATSFDKKAVAQLRRHYRTAYLLSEVKNAPAKKILIIYGKGHLEGFEQGLKAAD